VRLCVCLSLHGIWSLKPFLASLEHVPSMIMHFTAYQAALWEFSVYFSRNCCESVTTTALWTHINQPVYLSAFNWAKKQHWDYNTNIQVKLYNKNYARNSKIAKGVTWHAENTCPNTFCFNSVQHGSMQILRASSMPT